MGMLLMMIGCALLFLCGSSYERKKRGLAFVQMLSAFYFIVAAHGTIY